MGNLLLEFICCWLLPPLVQSRVLNLPSSPGCPGAFCMHYSLPAASALRSSTLRCGEGLGCGAAGCEESTAGGHGQLVALSEGLGVSHGVEPTAKTCRSLVGTHFSCLVSLVLLVVGFLNGGWMLSVLPGFWQCFCAFVFCSPSHILASVAIYNTHLHSLYSQQKMIFARLETNGIFFFQLEVKLSFSACLTNLPQGMFGISRWFKILGCDLMIQKLSMQPYQSNMRRLKAILALFPVCSLRVNLLLCQYHVTVFVVSKFFWTSWRKQQQQILSVYILNISSVINVWGFYHPNRCRWLLFEALLNYTGRHY